jgi:hypothetical protein
MVCYIMIPIYNPTWKLPRTEKARCTRGTDYSRRRRRRRRRQDLQEPTAHSARFRSHWRRVRLYWDASMSLLAWLKVYSSYKRRARRNRTKECNLTLSCPLILPVDRPWAQRYRGNDPCHLSTGDNPIRKFKYYPRKKSETRYVP